MTRDQMHNTLRYVREQLASERGSDFSGVEALDMVIAELEQEPSGRTMTREEAIKMLKSKMDGHTDTSYEWVETVRMAINALEQEQKTQMVDKSNFDVEQYKMDLQCAYDCGRASVEPSGDLISRQALLKLMGEEPFNWTDSDKELQAVEDYRNFRNMVEQLPSVNPQEPKTGHWISIDEEPHEVWECDHCGFVIDGSGCIDPYDYRDTYKFCPRCGAKMVEQERSDKE